VSIFINKETNVGLDQYAYVAARAGQNAEWWDGAELDPETRAYHNAKVTKPRELAYWRKHPNLQGWMEQLWLRKNKPNGSSGQEESWGSGFNGIELELTLEDLNELETVIKEHQLPKTVGFFFGHDSDQHYYQQDLEFVRQARAELFMGLKVFYNSSW
jgi:hypothetical protein